MSLLNSLLPEKPLMTVEDLIQAGFYSNSSQVQKAVDNGLPALRLGYRSLKFPRAPLLEWLERQLTKGKTKKKQSSSETEGIEERCHATSMPEA